MSNVCKMLQYLRCSTVLSFVHPCFDTVMQQIQLRTSTLVRILIVASQTVILLSNTRFTQNKTKSPTPTKLNNHECVESISDRI